MRHLLLWLGLLTSATFARAGEPQFGSAEQTDGGVLVHRVVSELQSAPTELRVLLPKELPAAKKLPVVYLLPVEAGRESRFGDGMAEAARLDAANRYGAIFVAPTFAALPWYADHPTDRTLAQEAYFLNIVMPFVERTYPALAEPRGRLLVGFSKSGWGAWSLLLRHPDRFGRAASWDAPLTMSWPSKYGSQPIFGTAENFEKYHIARLLDERAELLAPNPVAPLPPRLILLGKGNFPDHEPIHAQLEALGIPHVYHDGPQTPHVWDRAWLEPALDAILQP
ncbi:MAG: hypothetical protein C0483_08740 [Pirellula sp.]|nr:hypothetical protein [Pirellula sp.]